MFGSGFYLNGKEQQAMALMTWTDKLSVGVAVLDDDHRKLVAMVNELYDAMQAGHGKDSLGRILSGLVTGHEGTFRTRGKILRADQLSGCCRTQTAA